MEGSRSTWLIGGVVVAVLGAIVLTLMLPRLVGPKAWLERPWARAPKWQTAEVARVDDDGRDLLLLRQSSRHRNGDSPETPVRRVVAVDLATGEVVGERLSFATESLVAHRPGQLWVGEQRGDRLRVLALPTLAHVADLSALVRAHPEPAVEDIQRVDFPADTTSARLLARDGFLWDLDADLKKLVRMHHDTPVQGTPSMARHVPTCRSGTVELPSGRVAQLDGRSRRPALRVAEKRGALEMHEVETPHEGFLGGVFLCGGSEIVRAPEDVFVRFLEDGDGPVRERVAAVSAATGHRWTRGEQDWLGGTTRDAFVIHWSTLKGDLLVLWTVRTRNPDRSRDIGHHTLLGVDVLTGDARWITRL